MDQSTDDDAVKKESERQERLKRLRPAWKPGQSGNPAGRTPGSRTRFSEAFCQDMLDDWAEHGIEAVRAVRIKDPSTYLRVAASLIPKQFTMKSDDATLDRFLDGLGHKELNELIAGLCALGAAGAGEGSSEETAPIERPAGIH